jgi:hypothetical protein
VANPNSELLSFGPEKREEVLGDLKGDLEGFLEGPLAVRLARFQGVL